MKKRKGQFALPKLKAIFAGKPVKITITYTGKPARQEATGVCKAFHNTESGVDTELYDGSRYGFIPDTLTENSVEGNSQGFLGGRRKIELV